MSSADFILDWRGTEVTRETQERALDAIERAARKSHAAILEGWRASMPFDTGRMRKSATLTISRTKYVVRLHFRAIYYYYIHRTHRRMRSQSRELAIAIVNKYLPGELAGVV